MDSNEYRIRCKNFRDKTRSSFKYLVEEFNYELKYDSNRSQSGSIIVDTLIYTNKKLLFMVMSPIILQLSS